MSRKRSKKIKFRYQRYSNEPGSVITHVVGASVNIGLLVLLLIMGARHGNKWHIISFSIYGVTVISMYLASSIYHLISKKHKHKESFRIIDHATVYLVIAGTYTPISLIILKDTWGWVLFSLTWVIALFGVIVKVFFMKRIHPWVSSILYLAIGWTGVVFIKNIVDIVPLMAVYWLLMGGVFYTIGMVFFGLGRLWNRRGLFGFHEIFHLFVLAGGFCHFWLLYEYVVYL